VSDPGLILISSDSFGTLLSARRMSHFGATTKEGNLGVNAALLGAGLTGLSRLRHTMGAAQIAFHCGRARLNYRK
jgi:hypothetical protein